MHFPDESFAGKFDHIVVRSIGNRAAVGDRRQPRAAPRAQHAVNPIAMDVSASPAAPRLHTFAEHLQNLIEFFAGQVAIRISAAHKVP